MRIDAPGRVTGGTGSLALTANLERTDQLDLGKTWDCRAGQYAPLAPWRGGVDDHRYADLGQERCHRREGPVHHIAFSIAVGRLRRERLPNLVQLEHSHRD